MKKIDRSYSSDDDVFLKTQDKLATSNSNSRSHEESKHRRIRKLRDSVVEEAPTPIWKGF